MSRGAKGVLLISTGVMSTRMRVCYYGQILFHDFHQKHFLGVPLFSPHQTLTSYWQWRWQEIGGNDGRDAAS